MARFLLLFLIQFLLFSPWLSCLCKYCLLPCHQTQPIESDPYPESSVDVQFHAGKMGFDFYQGVVRHINGHQATEKGINAGWRILSVEDRLVKTDDQEIDRQIQVCHKTLQTFTLRFLPIRAADVLRDSQRKIGKRLQEYAKFHGATYDVEIEEREEEQQEVKNNNDDVERQGGEQKKATESSFNSIDDGVAVSVADGEVVVGRGGGEGGYLSSEIMCKKSNRKKKNQCSSSSSSASGTSRRRSWQSRYKSAVIRATWANSSSSSSRTSRTSRSIMLRSKMMMEKQRPSSAASLDLSLKNGNRNNPKRWNMPFTTTNAESKQDQHQHMYQEKCHHDLEMMSVAADAESKEILRVLSSVSTSKESSNIFKPHRSRNRITTIRPSLLSSSSSFSSKREIPSHSSAMIYNFYDDEEEKEEEEEEEGGRADITDKELTGGGGWRSGQSAGNDNDQKKGNADERRGSIMSLRLMHIKRRVSSPPLPKTTTTFLAAGKFPRTQQRTTRTRIDHNFDNKDIRNSPPPPPSSLKSPGSAALEVMTSIKTRHSLDMARLQREKTAMMMVMNEPSDRGWPVPAVSSHHAMRINPLRK